MLKVFAISFIADISFILGNTFNLIDRCPREPEWAIHYGLNQFMDCWFKYYLEK